MTNQNKAGHTEVSVVKDRMTEAISLETEEYTICYFSYLEEETHDTVDLENAEVNAEKMKALWNQFTGIPDVAGWMEKVKKVVKFAASIGAWQDIEAYSDFQENYISEEEQYTDDEIREFLVMAGSLYPPALFPKTEKEPE